MQTYINRCHKESERHAAYPEQSTEHFNNFANITVNGDSITPQKDQILREEDHQEYCQTLFNKNEENKSIISSKTIESNANNKIESNVSNKIEHILSEQKEISMNQNAFNSHFKAYLENIPIPSLTTTFGRNAANQISTSMTDQLADTNRTRMEHM